MDRGALVRRPAWWPLVPAASRQFLEAAYPDPIAPDVVARQGAVAMASLLGSGRYEAARLVEVRRNSQSGAELLVVELSVPLGQRSKVHDIRASEPLAVAYDSEDHPPYVYPLRDDFPDQVPHFNLTHEGLPRSLCLFDLAQDEILRILTPYVLLERTRHWLSETAYGRLHGDDQPLDPVFGASGRPVVLPPKGVDPGAIVFGFRQSDCDGHPVLLFDMATARSQNLLNLAKGLAVVIARSPPLPHGRLRALPRTAGELLSVFLELGADLLPQLREQLAAWSANEGTLPLYARHLLLIVKTPIERSPGVVDGEATKAFIGDFVAGDLAEAIGAIFRAGGKIGPPLGKPVVDHGRLEAMSLLPMDVHGGFDRPLALAASGHQLRETLPVALIGAGALGSQIAMTAAREGLGAWSIHDPDHILPHNLARHALGPDHAGAPKALALAQTICGLLGDPHAATGLVGDVRTAPGSLADAALVIDASASVPVARWLASESGHASRSASAFFNPRGEDLVVLLEGKDRTPRLDELEMSYYWRLVSTPELHGHLHGGTGILPSGGCRSISMQVPQSSVSTFAGLAVRTLLEQELGDAGLIEVWCLHENGVSVNRWAGESYRRVDIDDWTVLVRESVIADIEAAREAAAGSETGGILVGAWDRQRRKAYIVGHYDPPPDSQHSATGFVRGMVGVYQSVQVVEDATAFNLSYVGEWHTHPEQHSSRPSQDDADLLRWIGNVLEFSDVPPLMAICGDDGFRVILGRVAASAIAQAAE